MVDTSLGLPAWLVRSLLHRQTIALEAFLGAQAVGWGLWVADPTHVAFSYWDAPTLLSLIPEVVVGLLVAVHGAMLLYFLHKRDTKQGRRAALVTAFIWTVVLASVVTAAPFSIGTPVYFGNVLGGLWVYLRLYMRFG